MKHIVQFSGGAGSAMAAYLVAQKVPKEDIILLFHDVKGGHDEDMYRFNADVSAFLGITITEYSLDKSIWDVIKEQKCLPSYPWHPFCTRILKTEVADRFYSQLSSFVNPYSEQDFQLYSDEPFTLYNGYGVEEKNRIQKQCQKAPYKVEYPVCNAGLTSVDCKRIISEEWGIELPRAYQWFEHNNCIPCWKSGSKEYWHKVWKYYPERYQMAIEMEEYTGHTHFKKISLQELAEQWELKGKAKTNRGEVAPC
jgi:hypothetical protein